MKKILIFQFLFVIILLPSCNDEKKGDEKFCENIPLEESTLKDSIEYKIINSVLDDYYSNNIFNKKEQKTIYVDQETDSTWSLAIDDIKDKLKTENIDYDSLIVLSYFEKNKTIYYLSDSLLNNYVQIISHNEINCFFSFIHSGWEKYYQKYPNSYGFLTLSRPGVNLEGNKAIIELIWQGDYDEAICYIIILEKINNIWIITNRLHLWQA